MKAIIITAPGGSDMLDERDVAEPQPGLGEIRVRVHASALNRADVSQRKGTYSPPPGAPKDIPGLEYAGEVDAVGDAVTLWKRGDRVMGLVGGGAHAELVCTHEREAMRIPPSLTYEDAAAIPEAFITAYDAIFAQLKMQVGERLLIHAAGSGVGTAAIQLARKAGIRTIGTSRTAAKLAGAMKLGLDVGVEASGDNWQDRVAMVAPEGLNAVLDLVGGPYVAGDLQVLASRGRVIVVGLTGGRTHEINLGLLMHKRIAMTGTVLRSRPIEEKITIAREFAERVLPSFDDGFLVPVIDRVIRFSKIREALVRMESNETFGKIVLNWA